MILYLQGLRLKPQNYVKFTEKYLKHIRKLKEIKFKCIIHLIYLNGNPAKDFVSYVRYAVKETPITHNTFGNFCTLSCYCRKCFSKHLHPSFKLSFAVCSNIRCVLVSCCGMEILWHSRTKIFIRERKKVRGGFLTMIFSILTYKFLVRI